MWWPITGKVDPVGQPREGNEGRPRIDTGRFAFRAVPADISGLNQMAAGDAPYDVTALSVRAYADAASRYTITRCGGSFGEGYGPKIVCRADCDSVISEHSLKADNVTIAVPGKRTSAFMALGLLLGPQALRNDARFIEMPFTSIIPAVVGGNVTVGLVIHEGQLAFAQAGLRQVVDLGAWWSETRAMPLPLGVNAVKRDLDARHGAGTIAEVVRLLRASLDYALAHRTESLEYTLPFAALNATNSDVPAPSPEAIDRYLRMYVTPLTVDMGELGRRAIERFLREGADAGLCPSVAVDLA